MIGNLLNLADRILIGGGMAYTFLAAQGYEVGNSVLEADQIPAVKEVMAEAARRGVELVLPVDLVAATHFAPDAEHSVVAGRPRSRPTGRAWTRARRPASCSRRSWPTPGPCSGTGRWACSSSRRSRRAPARWPRRVAAVDGLTVVGGGDSAAAVRALGHRREVVRAHLHRRRRQPRVPRGQDAARADRAGDGLVMARARTPGAPATGCR